jgi:sterol desaturase/sphingolipid hydroxylase (fatty acid hydroxylase superfamily)
MLRATPDSPRMFESEFLDLFSRIPAAVVPALFIPISFALIGYGVTIENVVWYLAIPQFLAGWFVWSLMEYWLHRTFFHWIPDTSWGARMHFLVHGVHHDWPNDKYRLVMPPVVSLGLAVLFFSATWLVGALLAPILTPTWIWTFFGGLVFGYMVYDCTHYYIHHFRPRTAYMKRLRAHHMAHHHNPRYADMKFGVSMTVWDYVFRTISD